MNKYFISYFALDRESGENKSDVIIFRLFDDEVTINNLIYRIYREGDNSNTLKDVSITNISKL